MLTAWLVLLNGAFVVAEVSVLSARRARLEEWASSGRRGASRALGLLDDADRTLEVSQLGVSTVAIVLGWRAVPALGAPVDSLLSEVGVASGVAAVLGVALALAAVVALQSVVGELLPRSVALAAPERILCSGASLIAVVVALLGPVAAVPVAGAKRVTRLLGVVRSRAPGASRRGGEARTSAQLAALLSESRAGDSSPRPSTSSPSARCRCGTARSGRSWRSGRSSSPCRTP